MFIRTNISTRWILCSLLLVMQLVSGMLSAASTYRLPQNIDTFTTYEEEDSELTPASTQVTPLDTDDLRVNIPKCKRIKPRYYVSAFYSQYNLTAKPAGIISYNNEPDIFTPERKKGVYMIFSEFLPGYYQFLFRLSPF